MGVGVGRLGGEGVYGWWMWEGDATLLSFVEMGEALVDVEDEENGYGGADVAGGGGNGEVSLCGAEGWYGVMKCLTRSL